MKIHIRPYLVLSFILPWTSISGVTSFHDLPLSVEYSVLRPGSSVVTCTLSQSSLQITLSIGSRIPVNKPFQNHNYDYKSNEGILGNPGEDSRNERSSTRAGKKISVKSDRHPFTLTAFHFHPTYEYSTKLQHQQFEIRVQKTAFLQRPLLSYLNYCNPPCTVLM